jgi:hypothetical protein
MSGDGEVDNQVFQVDLIVGFERSSSSTMQRRRPSQNKARRHVFKPYVGDGTLMVLLNGAPR